jgi:hypothetical protein
VFGDVGGLVEAGFWAFRVRVLLSWLWGVRVFDLAFVYCVLGELVRVGSPSVGGNWRIQSFDLGDVGSQLVERTRSSKVPVPGATNVSLLLIVLSPETAVQLGYWQLSLRRVVVGGRARHRQ